MITLLLVIAALVIGYAVKSYFAKKEIENIRADHKKESDFREERYSRLFDLLSRTQGDLDARREEEWNALDIAKEGSESEAHS